MRYNTCHSILDRYNSICNLENPTGAYNATY